MIFAVPATSEFGSKPQVTVVCPNTGPSAGGTPVTITGKNLKDAVCVAFGATSLGGGDFTVVSDTEIQTTSPAGTSAVNVTVSIPSGAGSGTFTYNAAAVLPPSGTGTLGFSVPGGSPAISTLPSNVNIAA